MDGRPLVDWRDAIGAGETMGISYTSPVINGIKIYGSTTAEGWHDSGFGVTYKAGAVEASSKAMTIQKQQLLLNSVLVR